MANSFRSSWNRASCTGLAHGAIHRRGRVPQPHHTQRSLGVRAGQPAVGVPDDMAARPGWEKFHSQAVGNRLAGFRLLICFLSVAVVERVPAVASNTALMW